uniref:Uncharacterized protein n=1 Tax=Romanomermis culicivorax TaxID=13658 RepID=A0A915J130_ROMCU
MVLKVINVGFEDSSSLSSELSENLDEISTDDLTGSSLSDHTLYCNLRPQRKTNDYYQENTSGVRKVEIGQQTERRSSNNPNGMVNLQNSTTANRKMDEFDQQRIDSLLQKCRTSSRGLAVVGNNHQSGHDEKNYLSSSGPTIDPLVALKRDQALVGNNSHCGDRYPNYNLNSNSKAGYHSLDRKKHFYHQIPTINDFSTRPPDDDGKNSQKSQIYSNYVYQNIENHSSRSNSRENSPLMAMISPRHVPGIVKNQKMSLTSTERQMESYSPNEKDIMDSWTRHNDSKIV